MPNGFNYASVKNPQLLLLLLEYFIIIFRISLVLTITH